MCTFPDCDRQLKCKGLCSGHYQQLRKGNDLLPLRPSTVPAGMRWSTISSQLLPIKVGDRIWREAWLQTSQGLRYTRRHNLRNKRRACGAIPDDLPLMALCPVCGSTDHLCYDHIVPVTSGGLSTRSNLSTLCRSCNSSKGTKSMFEWWRSRSLAAGYPDPLLSLRQRTNVGDP